MSREYVAKFYNLYSPIYNHTFGLITKPKRHVAPRLMALPPGAKMLEVGVGTGLSLEHMPSSLEIVGIDMSEKMLELAQKRVLEHDLKNVKLLQMDAMNQSFDDNTFDGVLAAYVVSVVPDPLMLVSEMKRVCKPGGYLLFLNHFLSETPGLRQVEQLISPVCYRLGFRTNLDMKKLMHESGLEIEHVEKIDQFGNWKAVRCINP